MYPSYSPDGTKIAYYSRAANPTTPADYEIFTMNADGTGTVQLTHNSRIYDPNRNKGGDGGPSYSPDGKRIAYSGHAVGNQLADIYTINSDGTGDAVQLAHRSDENDPSYSPDGTKIAYSGFDGSTPRGDYEIFTMNADGTGTVQLTHNDTDDLTPDWGSPPVVGIKPQPPPLAPPLTQR